MPVTAQKVTGWAIVVGILLLLWWLLNNALGFLHGTGTTTTVVQSGIALPGGQQNTPTTTTYCDTCS